MSKRNLLAIAFLLTLGVANLHGQDILKAELLWKSDKVTNLLTNEELLIASSLKSHSTTSVDWIQRNGAKVYAYTVTSVVGSWADVSANGEITYSISSGDSKGEIIFKRQPEGATATLRLEREGKITSHFKFTIISIERQ
jgi:hypothetical protein